MQRKKVLVAALNWGLGHATRCIPVIKALEVRGCDVAIASDGASLRLLQEEFPRLKAFTLPSYGVKYSAVLPMALGICGRLPAFAMNIHRENRALRSIHARQRFDAVISDGRFGCRIPGIVGVYMTHQVRIKFPAYLSPLEGLGAALHAMVWKKFDRLWVIDRPGEQGLSGVMGHCFQHPKLRFVGILSRFLQPDATPMKKIDVCFLLSGPEPHRTMFEKAVVGRTWPASKTYCLVRGLPGEAQRSAAAANWTIENHLPASRLRDVLLSSRMIVCRSGYSTIMDLARLGLRPLLIPTPGQPEQEYLAAYMARRFQWPVLSQKAFVNSGITGADAGRAAPFHESNDDALLASALDEVIGAAGRLGTTA